jgi:hypothetical protein
MIRDVTVKLYERGVDPITTIRLDQVLDSTDKRGAGLWKMIQLAVPD